MRDGQRAVLLSCAGVLIVVAVLCLNCVNYDIAAAQPDLAIGVEVQF
jgi:hypothetical protein